MKGKGTKNGITRFDWAMLAWLMALVALGAWQYQHLPAKPVFMVTKTALAETPQAKFIRQTLPSTTLSVHSATLAHIDSQNQLMTAWFGGSREGAKDVQIYASWLDLDKPNAVWSAPKVIVSPQSLAAQSGTYIKKLGNPVLYQAQDGTVHLFVVATSYAGWAAAKIYHLTKPKDTRSDDEFVFRQILPLSPLVNVSHLVRTPPVALADGGFYLPVYHELAHKFEVLLRFDNDGNLIQKIRPNHLTQRLQPTLVALNDSDCLMTARNRHSSPILIQKCHQGGLQWDNVITTTLNNDNNSLNIFSFDKNNYLTHNQSKNGNSRYALWLSHLSGQFNITPFIELDYSDQSEVSYPTTLVVGDTVHIVYTYERTAIRHIAINNTFIKNAKACLPTVTQPDTQADNSGDLSNHSFIHLTSAQCQLTRIESQ